jgi:CubicO group peptidase (beta-lactamase class C family)
VEEGTLQLDTDVNEHLKSWKVPQNRHTRKHPATRRTILSHTAGFNIHGFADFQPGAQLPSVLDTLNGRSPARHRAVRVTFLPGSGMDYSGGGTTVSQLAVSDSTGLNYVEAARRLVFAPLKMTRSTFENPLPGSINNVAHAHDDDGDPATRDRGWEAMPEMAASGLWTNADDLAKFVISLIESYRSEDGFISASLAKDMMSREQNSWYGLGPRINGKDETLVFHHGGANDSYRAWIEGHLNTGDGIVVLTNGTNGHFIYQEIRRSAQEAFGWRIKSGDGFEEPDL